MGMVTNFIVYELYKKKHVTFLTPLEYLWNKKNINVFEFLQAQSWCPTAVEVGVTNFLSLRCELGDSHFRENT